MAKINKNLIGFGLLIMAIFCLGAIIPKTTDAYMTYGQYVIPPDAPLPPQNPHPIITYITPRKIDIGQGSQVVRVAGSGFIKESVVQFDGQARPTAYESPSRLLVRLSERDVNKLGDHIITVENPGPGGGVSHARIFEVERKGRNYDDIRYQGEASDDFYGSDSDNRSSSRDFYRDEDFGKNISGSAINSGFFPSTFMQWLALAILLLLIVIIWRRLYRKKHEEPPLKHA